VAPAMVMETSVFRYILRHSKREQGYILFIVLVSMLFYYLALNLPKTIVNEAIQGNSFPTAETEAPFLHTVVGVPAFLGGGEVELFPGVPLDRIGYLMALSFSFLGMVLINNGLKYYINTTKGRLGERMLRRLRYQLFDRIMRFPLPHFRKVKGAELATMIKDEVEPLGGFIGDAFVTPAFLGGQALTAMLFIMMQSVALGSVALAVVLAQAIIIPRLRKRILRLGRQRQLTARALAGRVAECVDGAREIHANDTSNYERADIADRLGLIFKIRFELYQRKFATKMLNNLLAQVTPFVFYSVGGYFAIMGDLDIGALVAVIAAYKDMPGPLKELIDWDQQRQDVQIKYEQVIEQFQPDRMLPEEAQQTGLARPERLSGDLVASNVTYADEGGVKLIDALSFRVAVRDKVAVVGGPGSGKRELAMLLGGLIRPTGGMLTIDSLDLGRAAEGVTGRGIGYVGPDTYLFPLTLRQNLMYSLWHEPTREREYPEEERRAVAWQIAEAKRTGNMVLDVRADWVDYESAGVASAEELDARLLGVLQEVEFERDVYELGLRGVVDPAVHPGLAAAVLRMRQMVRRQLEDPRLAGLVEPFDWERYNANATLGENLLFGVPVNSAFNTESLAQNPYVQTVLERAGLSRDLLDLGRNVAATMVELFAGLSPGHEFFERYSFIRYEDLAVFKALLSRAEAVGLDKLSADDRARLTSLSFKLLPAHRLGGLEEPMQARIVAARHVFKRDLPAELQGTVAFYDAEQYSGAAPLLDNILFGKVAIGLADANSRVQALVAELLEEAGLRDDVVRAGLEYSVGVGGTRLSGPQRQKIALARALLKRPDLFVLDEATATLEGGAQKKVMDGLLRRNEPFGVVWMLHRASLARQFDIVLLMRDGRIVEKGTYDELNREGSLFAQLLQHD